MRPHPKLADAGVILREATGNYDRATVVLRTLGEESGLPASSTRWTLQALANFTFNLPSTAAMKSPAEFGLVGEVVTDLGFGPKERLQVLRRLAAAGGGSLSAEDASSGSTQLNEFTGLYRAHYPVGA